MTSGREALKRVRLGTPPGLHPSADPYIHPSLFLSESRNTTSKTEMNQQRQSSEKLVLDFKEDTALTEMMRLRVSSLQKTGQKRQDGERLLLPYEAVYRLDFPVQELNFSRWYFSLSGHGRVTITGISQHWTPDLTNLMTRQLLEPIGTFWRNAEDPEESPLKWLEADMQEFGERIAELAKVRKVMYFLFAFKDGSTAANLSCTIEFTPEK
ncbi:PREDICTED: olfactory marker protein [Cyprinodon variegatus]|uniref:Olfactory marker protein a n=1 Tax=Cyprinodon variegatus TaxID=28743 RepID=A0A3Q2DXH6_CYPVA|nr:PREDICTED: olfactory marker protein [Cyprinodon variegatus]